MVFQQNIDIYFGFALSHYYPSNINARLSIK